MAPGSDYELWTTLAPLEGPTGRRQTRYTPYDDYYSSFSITDKCKNPEAAIRLADFMLTEEATLRNCNGVKDVNWRYVTEDLPSIDDRGRRGPSAGSLLEPGGSHAADLRSPAGHSHHRELLHGGRPL